MPFEPGRPVLYRNVAAGELLAVRPCLVVSDDDRGLLLWLARGSVVAVEAAPDGRGIRSMPFAEWVRLPHHVVESRWQGPGILKFFPPDVDHSVWFFFDDDGGFAGWCRPSSAGPRPTCERATSRRRAATCGTHGGSGEGSGGSPQRSCGC